MSSGDPLSDLLKVFLIEDVIVVQHAAHFMAGYERIATLSRSVLRMAVRRRS
jgi:hypothetical protein